MSKAIILEAERILLRHLLADPSVLNMYRLRLLQYEWADYHHEYLFKCINAEWAARESAKCLNRVNEAWKPSRECVERALEARIESLYSSVSNEIDFILMVLGIKLPPPIRTAVDVLTPHNALATEYQDVDGLAVLIAAGRKLGEEK